MKKTGITLTDDYDNVLNINIDGDGDVTIQLGEEVFSFKDNKDLDLFSKNVVDLLILAGKKDEN